MATTKLTLIPNEIHKPSVSFLELEDNSDPLAESVLNGKAYFTKSFLRSIEWKGERLNVTITKGERVQ